MKPDESSSAYLTRAQEYATALANIGEPMKEKDIVMLVISGLREEYHGLKTTALTRQLAFNELHALFANHDYMLQKSSTAIHPTQAFIAALKSSPTVAPPSDDAVQACGPVRVAITALFTAQITALCLLHQSLLH